MSPTGEHYTCLHTYIPMYAYTVHSFLLCRIIQYYVMREDAGTLARASSEQHKASGGEGR